MRATQEIYNLVSWDKILFSSGGGSVSKVILWHATNFSVLSETQPHGGNNTNHMIKTEDGIISCGNGDPRLVLLSFNRRNEKPFEESHGVKLDGFLRSCV